MLKPLFCVCLFGLCVATVFADESNEWFDDYNDDDNYEYKPIVEGKGRIHKIEELENDERYNKDIEQFKKEIGDDIKEAENEAYDQYEDNRSEADIKRNGDQDIDAKDNGSKVLDTPEIDYSNNSEQNDKEIKSLEKEADPMEENEFEQVIINHLNEKKEQTSEKDIIEETKAILKEEDGNDFQKIRPLKEDVADINDIIDETSKLLEETDDSFNDNTKNVSSTETHIREIKERKPEKAVKPYAELQSNLQELHDIQNKISGDEDDIKDEAETYDDSDENPLDYIEVSDDKLDMIFSDKPQEKSYDDEILRDDSPIDEETSQPIFFFNDALSAGGFDSTRAPETTMYTTFSEEVKTTQQSDAVTTKDEQKSTTHSEKELSTSTTTDKLDIKLTNENHTNNINVGIIPLNIVEVHLNVNESTLVVSPNYPNPYPTREITDYIISGDGMGIEMNVTDFAINSFIGDYVKIIPGQSHPDGTVGLLLSYNLKSERRFRFTDADRMFIRFEAMQGMQFQRGFSISLKMIMPRSDVVEVPTDDGPVIRTSEDSLTVNLGGVAMNRFFAIREDFRRIIADMATMYINANGIELGLNSTLEVTQIRGEGICFHNWPGSELCTEVAFGVPLQYDDDELETRFTKQDLRDMWERYSTQDPFAVRLELLGIVEFTYPDDRSVLTVWLVVAAGVVVSMAMLAFALWRYSCFEQYTKMPSYSDTDSLNDKRVLDLYPTPHQTLPPLYSEDIQWADEKYDIGKDHGYSNNSFLRDDMFDIDSDDDTLRTHNGYRPAAISPRDIYHV